MKNEKGFTLVETLIAVSIAGVLSTGAIKFAIDELEKDKQEKAGNEFVKIIGAVENRLLLDGFSESHWNQNEWKNTNEVINNLLREQLIAADANCSTGSWEPQDAEQKNAKLVDCLIWNKMPFDMQAKAELKKDSAGFVESFELILNFKDKAHFEKEYQNLQRSLFKARVKDTSDSSSNHSYSFVDLNTKTDISNTQCINLDKDCSVMISYNRAGSFDYVRTDGSNSMLDSHLSFIDGSAGSGLTCAKWTNDKDDNSGAWIQTLDEDCGIGIYKQTGVPAAVDVVADNGSFKSVVLDEECILYEWNGTNVVDSTKRSPCGMVDNGSTMYQVIPNLNSQAIIALSAKLNDLDSKAIQTDQFDANEATLKSAKIQVANIDSLVSKVAVVDDMEIINTLKTALIDSSTGTTTFNSSAIFTQDTDMQRLTATEIETPNVFATNIETATINGVKLSNGYHTDIRSVSDIETTGEIKAKNFVSGSVELFDANGKETSQYCISEGKGAISTDKRTGRLLYCSGTYWKAASEYGEDSAPFGSIMLVPFNPANMIKDGWLELRGQSIINSSIINNCDTDKLKSVFGTKIPDWQGLFVRGAGIQYLDVKWWSRRDQVSKTSSKIFGYSSVANRKSSGYMQNIEGRFNTDDRSARNPKGVFRNEWNPSSGGADGGDSSTYDVIFDNSKIVRAHAHETAPAFVTAHYVMKCK